MTLMPPRTKGGRKRGAQTTGNASSSPKRQRKAPDDKDGEEGVARPSTIKKGKVAWRLLPQDTIGIRTLDLEGGEEDDLQEGNDHTAHFAATMRSSAVADWLQQGASEAGHVDDVVAINDLFAAKVEEEAEKVELGVVRELEAGSIPEELLPAPIASLLRHKEREHHQASEVADSEVAAKLQTDRDLDGLWEALGVQQREELEEAENTADEGAVSFASQSLEMGATFSSMQAAEHFVRIRSQVAMRVVPGHSKKCKVWCCRSNKAADKADGTRGNPAADGSRAAVLQAGGGCQAVVQVLSLHLAPLEHRTTPSNHKTHTPTDCSWLGARGDSAAAQARDMAPDCLHQTALWQLLKGVG